MDGLTDDNNVSSTLTNTVIPGKYLIQYYSGSIGPRSYGLFIYIERESSEVTYPKEKSHLK